MCPSTARALDDEPAQRLPQLEPRRRARLAAERDDAAHLGDLVEQRASGSATSGQPARWTDSGPSSTSVCQRCSVRNGMHRREHAQRLHERVPERVQRGLVAVPEPAPRAADVPVREIVDDTPRRRASRRARAALVAGRRVGDERVRALDEPAVERLEVAPARASPTPAGTPSMFA